jgi:hypothetical protein
MKLSIFARLATVWITLFTLSGMSDATGVEPCPLAVQITPTRYDWHAGEPVEIRVHFSNPENSAAVLPLHYPSLGGLAPGIAFSLSANFPAPPPSNTIVSLVEIAARSSWDVHVYANKFIPAFAIGINRVNWRLEMACLNSQKAPLTQITQSGWFDIHVDGKPSANPASIVNFYLERLDRGGYPARWERQEAVEAVSNMSDPAVLPALQKLYQYGERSTALQALRKFDGNREAARILVNMLHSADGYTARDALQVAKDWRMDLAPDLLAELLSGDNQPMKLLLVGYLGARRSAAYDELLQRLTAGPDDILAQAAKTALTTTPLRQ